MDDTDEISEETSGTNKFLAMWCNEGLECIYDLTKWERDALWADLKGEKCNTGVPSFGMLIMRAMANTQRHYEIYIFTADSTISIDDLKIAFDDNPQHMVDFIRKNGSKLYSDRATAAPRII